MSIQSAIMKALLGERSKQLRIAAEERQFNELIEAVDAALIADFDKPSPSAKKEIDRAVDALASRVLEECKQRHARCGSCPYRTTEQYTLADGRALCEACSFVTRLNREATDLEEVRADTKRILDAMPERIAEAHSRYVAPLEAQRDGLVREVNTYAADVERLRRELRAAERAHGIRFRAD